MNKRRLGTKPVHPLQKIEGANGIDVKIVKRTHGRKIMTRLCCCMNHGVRRQLFYECYDIGPVAHIELVVSEPRELEQQPLLVPACIPPGTKEVSTHIVIHTVDFPAKFMKMPYHRRTNEAV